MTCLDPAQDPFERTLPVDENLDKLEVRLVSISLKCQGATLYIEIYIWKPVYVTSSRYQDANSLYDLECMADGLISMIN